LAIVTPQIVEYQESLSLAPKELEPRLNLALAQEKKDDWVAAVKQLSSSCARRRAPKIGAAQIRYDAQKQIPVRAAALPAAPCRSAFFR